MDKIDYLYIIWDCKTVIAILENMLAVSFKKKKVNIQVLYNPEISLLSIYIREIKTMHTKTFTEMFTVISLIIAKN